MSNRTHIVNYLTEEERTHPAPIWNEVAKALELCTADIPTCYEKQWQEKGCELIRTTCEKHGAHRVIECVLEHMKCPPFLELYWFARANIFQVIKYIEPYLTSKDEDELSTAIKALIYFDREDAWKAMEVVISGESGIAFEDKISWYFEEDLKNIGSQRALGLLQLMEARNI